MSGQAFAELAGRFVGDLEKAGANVLIFGDLRTRPLRCRVTLGPLSAPLEVYLWTITPGGKGRGRPDERRIQMTGVTTIPLRASVRVLLGGWSEEVGVYAFWDARRHQGFSAGSPSLQIGKAALEMGYHQGFGTEVRRVREGEEIAIAVQADYLTWYLEEWERLYECSADIQAAPELIDTSVEEKRHFVDSGHDDRERSRRHKVITIVENFRDARFRPIVLRAYGYRCCVTGTALRLVDAAHIIPASDPTSSDEVWNGMAMAVHVHRAYDNGLLGILPAGRIALNPHAVFGLKQHRLAAGLDELSRVLPPRIRFPGSPELYPRDDALLKGLAARGWTEDEIEAALRSA
jgi:putative restriction endonuclease